MRLIYEDKRNILRNERNQRLVGTIKEKEEDEEYLTWKREREEKRKKKQSDMEM